MNVSIKQLPSVNPTDDDFLIVEKGGEALTGRTTIGDFISFQGILTESSEIEAAMVSRNTSPLSRIIRASLFEYLTEAD